ncbi:MAG: ABC transporter substrate-binding protein, partial [Gammaproteobacteria bacterium]|nr:ABC transporter substrate-binding protein [Gammaproteobacteria bacterium]
MRGQSVWLWGAGLLLLAFIGFAVLRETPESVPGSGGEESATPPKQASTITVSIASSNTKQEWLHAAVKRFNELAARDEQYQVNGKPIYVVVLQEDIDGKKVDYRSGVMVSRTASGEINPTVISPGDESWLDRFREAWKLRYGTRPIGRSTPVLVRTPLVLAMWQSRAKTLGCWPDANPECTWQRIRELASDQGGWKRYDHPEWGRFKLGYGYFGKTNSGTLAVTAMCSVAADKTEGDLTMDEVDANSPCGHLISDVEAAKVHSGKSDRWLLERMVAEGAEYLDAVVTYESNVIAANRKYGDELREPLVSMYPQDGTFIVGHPYAILDGAPWVSEEQAVAADVFGQFLLDREQQASVLQLGLRPADSSVKLKHPIEMALGANPTTLLTTLGMPEQLVVERLGEVWHEVKKHAAIAIVFDKSG